MKVFGLEIKKPSVVVEKETIAPPQPDGSLDIETSGGYGANSNHYYINYDFATSNDKELIKTYRKIAKLADVDDAVDEIVNETIVVEDQQPIVEIMLDNTDFSKGIKNKIADEFEYLLGLLNFHDCGDQILRQWYIDGRHYYHKVVDPKKTKEGIKSLDWLDPTKTKKMRELEKVQKKTDEGMVEVTKVKDEYFLYDPSIHTGNESPQVPFAVSKVQNILKLSLDSVSYTTSGLMDFDVGQVQGYLHKAVKPANQLTMLEDSMVVYRLTRAPERRIFYIDIGNLGSTRAEQYVRGIMNKYKNKLVYNVESGAVDASKVHMSMMEDIWLPRKEGNRGTEVQSLPAGANLGDINDILYFKRRLTKALKIPVSRQDAEGALFSIGVSGEVTRDELKFTKYVDKVRRRFNTFFYDLLRTQLLLKGVMTDEEWSANKHKIGFLYNRDSYIAELQKAEMWRQRFEILGAAVPYTGKDMYLSQRWNRDNILKLTEEEVKQIEKDWKTEPLPVVDGDGEPPEATPAKRPVPPPEPVDVADQGPKPFATSGDAKDDE